MNPHDRPLAAFYSLPRCNGKRLLLETEGVKIENGFIHTGGPILFDNAIEAAFLPESVKTEAVHNLAALIELTNREPREIYKRRFERMKHEITMEILGKAIERTTERKTEERRKDGSC